MDKGEEGSPGPTRGGGEDARRGIFYSGLDEARHSLTSTTIRDLPTHPFS